MKVEDRCPTCGGKRRDRPTVGSIEHQPPGLDGTISDPIVDIAPCHDAIHDQRVFKHDDALRALQGVDIPRSSIGVMLSYIEGNEAELNRLVGLINGYRDALARRDEQIERLTVERDREKRKGDKLAKSINDGFLLSPEEYWKMESAERGVGMLRQILSGEWDGE